MKFLNSIIRESVDNQIHFKVFTDAFEFTAVHLLLLKIDEAYRLALRQNNIHTKKLHEIPNYENVFS